MEPVARDQREMVRYTRKRKGEESRSDFRKEKMKETRRSKDMGCAGCRKTALVWTGGGKRSGKGKRKKD